MDNKSFSETLIRLRKEKGLTQADVAERLSVSPQAVSKWEKGDSFPDVSLLAPLARLFGVSVDELLSGEKPTKVEVVEPEGGDLSKIFLRIRVDSNEGDKVRVNLPFEIVEACTGENGKLEISGDGPIKNIDFRKIIELVKKGVIGELVSVESKDGDIVKIYAEVVQ